MLIFGVNPVAEALRAGRVRSIRAGDRTSARVQALIETAGARGIAVRRVSDGELQRAARGGRHQGIVADVFDAAPLSIEDLVVGGAGTPLIVVLDGIEDPQNVGAILRTADAAGVDGIVRQSRRAAPLDGAAAKASAGAVAHVKVAEVVNIARALEDLKRAGLWVVGLGAEAPRIYDEVDYTLPTALVLGAEGSGLRRLVRERCDWIVSIPMQGRVQSLNVSVAAAVALFEAVRQRRRQSKGDSSAEA